VRLALVLCLLLPCAVRADLYRWVDPENGSVRFSNYAPPEPAGRVEVVPYSGPGVPRAPVDAVAKSAAKPSALAALEAQWRLIKQTLEALFNQPDFERAGSGLAEHAEAYRAVRAEMDRVDPAGAARRRAEDEPLLARLTRGLNAQMKK
jgi:hypothetical protein